VNLFAKTVNNFSHICSKCDYAQDQCVIESSSLALSSFIALYLEYESYDSII
jgi:hypothetical protein